MNYIVHAQITAKSIVTSVIPPHVHLVECTDLSQLESELSTTGVEVVCIEAPRLSTELCDTIRYLHDCFFPIKLLVLLSTPSPHDIVRALELGADDCLGTHCLPGLLKIKIKQLLQLQKLKTRELLSAGAITLSPQSGELWLDQTKVALRKRESQILQCLLQYQNRVVTRDLLLDHVWMGEEEIPADVTIDVYIRRIRMILREHQDMLKTVRGFGYRLSVPVASA